jgi:hypothetical protein
MSHARRSSGQASVEAVAVVPLVVLAGAVALQVGLAAHAWDAAREAARAGARATLVDAPARPAATRVLGEGLARGARVTVDTGGGVSRSVRVEVSVPMVLPWVPAPRVGADARVPRA